MADPVKGSNVLLQVYKSGQYRDFLCATNLTLDFNAEMKSIKTIGDGVWKRQRPQNIGYTVKLEGLIKLNTGNDASSFDILGYMTNFVDLVYRITFEDDSANLKVIYGQGVVSTSEFSGGSDGFATSSFTLLGNGEPQIQENLTVCGLSIDSVTLNDSSTDYVYQSVTINYSGTGLYLRFEYSTFGGPTYSTTSTTFNIPRPLTGSVVYNFYPVCTNGFYGTGNTATISVNDGAGGPGGGGGGGTGPA